MARVDRRILGGKQCKQRRLRAPQVKGHLIVTVDLDLGDVLVPVLARILAQRILRLAHQQIEGALDVVGRERLAVVPLHACRSLNVSSVWSSFHDQLLARSGTIDWKLFWATSCLYMTRLLKIGMNGITVEYVASS